jgi:hypothetical protein
MADDERPRIVATFDSYAGMLEAIRARVNELQIHGERFDAHVGLPEGYLSKLAGARPIRRLGMTSLAPVLSGLGLKCQFIEDPAAVERLRNRLSPRNGSYVRSAAWQVTLTRRFLQKIGRLGGKANMARLTAKERSALARKAALARWRGS